MLSTFQVRGDEINGWVVEMFENTRGPIKVAEGNIADNKETEMPGING